MNNNERPSWMTPDLFESVKEQARTGDPEAMKLMLQMEQNALLWGLANVLDDLVNAVTP